MKRVMWAVTVLVLAQAGVASAQTLWRGPEIRPWVGELIPVGAQRDDFQETPMFGLQAAVSFTPSLQVVGSFGWAPGTDKLGVADNGVNVLDYNLGLELSPLQGGLRPFVGVGAGARTFLYGPATLMSQTCEAGYGAAGIELQVARTAFRVEGRGHAFCFRSPTTGTGSVNRNDIGVSFGVAYHLR
jgi:hypothetical protein